MIKRVKKYLILAPGQWKIVNGIRLENVSSKIMRMQIEVCDYGEEISK